VTLKHFKMFISKFVILLANNKYFNMAILRGWKTAMETGFWIENLKIKSKSIMRKFKSREGQEETSNSCKTYEQTLQQDVVLVRQTLPYTWLCLDEKWN